MAFYCVTFTKAAPIKRQGAEVIYWLPRPVLFYSIIVEKSSYILAIFLTVFAVLIVNFELISALAVFDHQFVF